MSTERDTHFSGFADSLQSELQSISPCTRQEASLVIAQRAYDLACHVLVSNTPALFDAEAQDVIRDEIPDLTGWPTPPASAPQDHAPD